MKTLTFAEPIDSTPGPGTTHADLGIPVRLGIGQEITSPKGPGGLTVEYLSLVEDSRCPSDQVCDVLGRAVVRIKLRVPTGPLGESDMVIEKGQVGTTVKRFGRFSVALLALDPEPGSEGTVSPEETRVTLVIFLPDDS